VKLFKDSELLVDIQVLLKATSTHSTEAHKVGGVYGGEDAHYLLDLDMAVLGAKPEKYADYREKIRGEYLFLSEPMYIALRLKVRFI
jgi:predicted metal-dependent HD superfamily phosphohydrolase